MNSAWTIELSERVNRRLRKLDRLVAKRITQYLRERIASGDGPRRSGKPLHGEFGNYWRYRVGDYRILCDIQDEKLVVLVVEIGNRRDVYR